MLWVTYASRLFGTFPLIGYWTPPIEPNHLYFGSAEGRCSDSVWLVPTWQPPTPEPEE